MDKNMQDRIKEALAKSNGKVSRWVLRLGKDDGKFDPWYAVSQDEDFEAFKLCLHLKRIHAIIEHRLSMEKKARTAAKYAIKGKKRHG